MSKYNFKKAHLLAGSAVVALGVVAAGQASADGHARVVKSSRDQVSLRISGQIHREVHVADDGVNTRVAHVDSNYSSSRFRFHLASKVNKDLRVGGLAEIAMDDARNGFDIQAPSGGKSGNDLQTRIMELTFTHSQLGKLSMGAGNAAANGVNNINLHGVSVALPNGEGFLGSTGLQYTREDDNTQIGSGVLSTHGDLDFNGREPRLRYDTPVLMGFVGSISHDSSQSLEYAIRWGGKMFDTNISAGVGMAQNTSGRAIEEQYGAQISFKHSSGLGTTFGCHYANSGANSGEQTEQDPAGCVVQGHFQRKFNEMGNTTLVVEYTQKDDVDLRGDIATMHGVTLKQDIDAAGLDVFAKYSNYDLERETIDTGVHDIDVFTIGSRVRF